MCQVTSVLSDSLQPYGLALQAPLSMGFSRQEYWSGLPMPFSRGSSRPRDKPVSLTSPALVGKFPGSATWEAPYLNHKSF